MAAIDLSRHGVIEASAGTGKTHTLTELAERLLVEEGATVDQLLLVTYTEKATGELKGRLRRRPGNGIGAAPGTPCYLPGRTRPLR